MFGAVIDENKAVTTFLHTLLGYSDNLSAYPADILLYLLLLG